MSTVHDRRKAMRGTKRTCQACEVRFYDLGREAIVCPMCGADYKLSAELPVAATTRAAPFSSKTGWHRQPLKRLPPGRPVDEAMPSDRFATGAADDEDIEDRASADGEATAVLDEQDDTGIAGLVERDDPEDDPS